MKSGIFVRPNLKLFVVAALVIVAADRFLSEDKKEDNALFTTSSLTASPLPEDQLDKLIERSLDYPTSQNYALISDCLRRRGETRQAMHYLRKASMAARLESEE